MMPVKLVRGIKVPAKANQMIRYRLIPRHGTKIMGCLAVGTKCGRYNEK